VSSTVRWFVVMAMTVIQFTEAWRGVHAAAAEVAGKQGV
jgi:hypothetical protein